MYLRSCMCTRGMKCLVIGPLCVPITYMCLCVSGVCVRPLPTLDIHDGARGAALPSHECGRLGQVLRPLQEHQLSERFPLLQPQGKCGRGTIGLMTTFTAQHRVFTITQSKPFKVQEYPQSERLSLLQLQGKDGRGKGTLMNTFTVPHRGFTIIKSEPFKPQELQLSEWLPLVRVL